MFNLEKEMKKLEKHLQSRPDDKLIEGYNKAMIDYQVTNNPQCKMAADIIKKEIDRRGLEVE